MKFANVYLNGELLHNIRKGDLHVRATNLDPECHIAYEDIQWHVWATITLSEIRDNKEWEHTIIVDPVEYDREKGNLYLTGQVVGE